MRFPLLSIAALALCAAGPAFAQIAAPAPVASPAPATVDADPALWVVKDADTTIYLFGTIHILKPGLSWFDEAVKTAFDKSDTLALEMVQPPVPEMQALVLRNGITATGPTLTEQLPEASRTAFASELTALQIPPAAFDRMRPWFAGTNLTLLPLMKLGYDPSSGAEAALTAAAKTAGKPVIGLETPEQQIGYLSGLSKTAELAMLTSTIDEVPKLGETIEKMVGTWSHGDADGLAKVMNDDLDESPELAKTLLFDRNARWADWIVERMKTPGTVFVAVGAGHLAGAKSVQAELHKRHVEAERVAY